MNSNRRGSGRKHSNGKVFSRAVSHLIFFEWSKVHVIPNRIIELFLYCWESSTVLHDSPNLAVIVVSSGSFIRVLLFIYLFFSFKRIAAQVMGNRNILSCLPSQMFSIDDRPSTSTREQHSTTTTTNPIMYINASMQQQSFSTRNGF